MTSRPRGAPGAAELERLLQDAEAALRRQQVLNELICETTPVGIITLDLEGQIVAANSWAEELLGLSENQATGRAYNDPRWHITDCDGGEFPDDQLPFRAALTAGKPVHDVRLAVEWPDGRRVFLSVNAAPIKGEDGSISAVLTVFDDISERISSGRKLEASEQRYQSLFNSMESAFSLQEIIHDEHGKPCDYRFLEVNPAFENLTGIPASRWIGRTVKEVLPATEPHWIELCGEVARTGRPTRVEYYAQEFERHYEVLAYCPAPNQCAALSTDVTERKLAEKALLQRSRLDATATLAGGVAHDLNNLMVGVLGNADYLRRKLSTEREVVEVLADIVRAGQQAGKLAQQLLSFCRPSQPKTDVIDPKTAVDETLRIQRASVPPRIAVEHDCAEGLWSVKADASQLVQVLMNLCLNAVEAIEGNGRINIRARNVSLPDQASGQQPALEPGRYVMLSVQDDGPGLEPAVRDRMFEPFFSTKEQGRGLGLAAVHGIVNSHGGDIAVRSEVGAGTTFDVYLPATERAEVHEKDAEDARLHGNETVLLIDDDQTVVRVVRDILTGLGYTVLTADCGNEALEIARKREATIHAAILDLGMPGMGGKELFPLLRRARPEMKILVCSGYARKGDAEELLQAGADGFVSKPFLVEELISPLRAALDGSRL